MDLVLKNGFVELSDTEMLISDGEGLAAAVTVEAFTILAGVKILVEGSIAAAGLYFV